MMAKKSERIYVKPAPGRRIVRDEITRAALAEEGEWKPRNTYWRRRIRMVDVVECKPPKAAPVEPTPQQSKKGNQS